MAVNLEPVLFVLRDELAHRFANRTSEPGLFLEGGINLKETVVHWHPCRIEDDFNDAKPGVDGIEQAAIALRRSFESCTMARQFLVPLPQSVNFRRIRGFGPSPDFRIQGRRG